MKRRSITNFFRRLFSRNSAIARAATPEVVKALIPSSSFTRTGPGIRHDLRKALLDMTPEQLQIAIKKGWDKGVLTKEEMQA